MNSTMNVTGEAGSAYVMDPRTPTSQHFTRFGVLGPVVTAQIASTGDPLGFSYERMLRGEADIAAGRVRSLADVMDALRSQVRRHGS